MESSGRTSFDYFCSTYQCMRTYHWRSNFFGLKLAQIPDISIFYVSILVNCHVFSSHKNLILIFFAGIMFCKQLP